MTAYYNELDPFAAQWLRELIKAGQIAPGIVDDRSIEDVRPDDIMGFTQCHFFAGIGVWSYALRRAGWPDERPVWTGSCPCQPFSSAGKGGGFTDERHLWPAFYWLIEQCRPAAIIGEQVASKAAGPWFDLVQADLEALGYAFACVPFPSAAVGAPHIRDRAYWLGLSEREGLERYTGHENGREEPRRIGAQSGGSATETGSNGRPGPLNGFWSDADWLFCRDGKWRPVEPGTFPLANGASNRVGRLRGYGNAINAEAAKVFIVACMDSAFKSTSF